MKNVLQRKHQRNVNKYFKEKHLEKQYAPPSFSFYISIWDISFQMKWSAKIVIYQRSFLPIIL